MEKGLLAVAASLTSLINNKVLGGITVFLITLIVSLYFLDKMENLTDFLTDPKQILQLLSICFLLLVAIGAVCYSVYHLFRKKP